MSEYGAVMIQCCDAASNSGSVVGKEGDRHTEGHASTTKGLMDASFSAVPSRTIKVSPAAIHSYHPSIPIHFNQFVNININ